MKNAIAKFETNETKLTDGNCELKIKSGEKQKGLKEGNWVPEERKRNQNLDGLSAKLGFFHLLKLVQQSLCFQGEKEEKDISDICRN